MPLPTIAVSPVISRAARRGVSIAEVNSPEPIGEKDLSATASNVRGTVSNSLVEIIFKTITQAIIGNRPADNRHVNSPFGERTGGAHALNVLGDQMAVEPDRTGERNDKGGLSIDDR